MTKPKSKKKLREWWCIVDNDGALYVKGTRDHAIKSAEWFNDNGEPRLAPYKVIKVREVKR